MPLSSWRTLFEHVMHIRKKAAPFEVSIRFKPADASHRHLDSAKVPSCPKCCMYVLYELSPTHYSHVIWWVPHWTWLVNPNSMLLFRPSQGPASGVLASPPLAQCRPFLCMSGKGVPLNSTNQKRMPSFCPWPLGI